MANPYDSPQSDSPPLEKSPPADSSGPSTPFAIVMAVAAVVVGWVIGSAVNMGLILAGFALVPLPAGVDVMDPESFAEGIHLFGPQHFVFPFLAHAAGTLVGATVAHLIAAKYRTPMAYVVALLFFAGGIYVATSMPSPAWFVVTDLALAYFPMAYLATRIGYRVRPRQTQ